LTVTYSTPILHLTTSYASLAPHQLAFQPEERQAGTRLEATAKEGVVGDEQEDYYAARRAEFERQFQALPPAVTAEYWQCVEASPETALPPEVLCRCLRERLREAKAEALRIFDVLFPQAQVLFQYWADKFVSQSRAGRGSPLAQDVESECYLALWKELASGKPTFLLENFQHALKRIAQHASHSVLEREGLWRRPGVEHPTRIQRSDVDSLDAARDNDADATLASTLADPQSQLPPLERETLIDLETSLSQLDETSRLVVFRYYYGGYSQQELADWLGTTDRTVRNRIDKIIRYLRAHLGGEEEQRG